jgi:hypothetical protein
MILVIHFICFTILINLVILKFSIFKWVFILIGDNLTHLIIILNTIINEACSFQKELRGLMQMYL